MVMPGFIFLSIGTSGGFHASTVMDRLLQYIAWKIFANYATVSSSRRKLFN
jgi:hypothetical protein